MPWRQSSPVTERLRFVQDVAKGQDSFAELCHRYGISRKTGYQWWQRFADEGVMGLEERSRRPRRSPTAISKQIIQLLKGERRRHPRWGPKKLLRVLRNKHPELQLPAVSTAAKILKQEGLIRRRRRPRRPATEVLPRTGWGTGPNDLWTADHKGQFRLGDGRMCYPLTLADSHSRYLLRVQACSSTRAVEARPVFERAFREYGLPARILTDNGPPFGGPGIAGLSRLSVWWLRLGIRIERIEPGCPEQNGQHERMHRTLKAEATKPSRANAKAQQRCFDAFRKEYNEERPHEALSQDAPAQHYCKAARFYPKETPGLDYPLYYERRQVRTSGQIKWHGARVFVSEVLAGETVGLSETDAGAWEVYFGPLLLGLLHPNEFRLRRSPSGSRARGKKKVLPMS
jgi:putative transposase